MELFSAGKGRRHAFVFVIGSLACPVLAPSPRLKSPANETFLGLLVKVAFLLYRPLRRFGVNILLEMLMCLACLGSRNGLLKFCSRVREGGVFFVLFFDNPDNRHIRPSCVGALVVEVEIKPLVMPSSGASLAPHGCS